MSDGGSDRWWGRIGPISLAALAATVFLLGVVDTAGPTVGLVVAGVGLALSIAWRLVGRPIGSGLEAVPVGLVFVYLLAAAPRSLISEVLGGVAGVALLFWLAGVRELEVGQLDRAVDLLLVPMAGFAVALGVSFIIPTGALQLGPATLLIIVAVIVVVVVLVRPAFLRAREARSY